MKYFRLVTLVASAATLLGFAYGTVSAIVQQLGFSGGAQVVFQHPIILLYGFYQTLGQLGLNIDFWSWNGPLVALALVVTLLIASIPGRS